MLLLASQPSLGRLADKVGEHLSSDVLMMKSNRGEPRFIQSFLNQSISEWVGAGPPTGHNVSITKAQL